MQKVLRSKAGKCQLRTVGPAVLVRTLFMLHNLLAVWRVAVSRDDVIYWCLATGNILIILEGTMVVRLKGGLEWEWWCPCFMTYLVTTLPSIWLLQLAQYDHVTVNVALSNGVLTSGQQLVTITTVIPYDGNQTTSTEIITTTKKGIFDASLERLLTASESTWIVLIQETLVYNIVFGRWMLPRNRISREALSDLLLQYLAMASDSMELFAMFDEQVVQKELSLNYAILSIWSLSFAQFIPVLIHGRHSKRNRKTENSACATRVQEVAETLMSVFFQDGPFMILRLYIMVTYNLVTYSLVFFVVKNIVTLMILFYRLVVLCGSYPCCKSLLKPLIVSCMFITHSSDEDFNTYTIENKNQIDFTDNENKIPSNGANERYYKLDRNLDEEEENERNGTEEVFVDMTEVDIEELRTDSACYSTVVHLDVNTIAECSSETNDRSQSRV